MEHKFLLGTNYWASHAGTDMWTNWDADVVDADLERLKQCNIKYLRVFPNWRDFQPVEPLYGEKGIKREPRLRGNELPTNPYYLDEKMLLRFREFCKIAKRHEMQLVVALITGWMSGKVFSPPLLWGKDIYRDSTALKYQQLLVQGMVNYFRDESCIYAWDLGNECNCMGEVDSADEAYNWTLVMTNAIKAADGQRPVISGMHSLVLEGEWNIQDQGAITDILTTHPYPFWVEHCSIDPMNSIRTLLHATIQNRYYQTVGKTPCLVEEIGTMGPMVCNDETAADFMRVNLFSNWANGAAGLMWWCANEQSHLNAPPYDWNMCERELGMVDGKGSPKPVLLELKKFSEFLKESQITLPDLIADGVCILTRGQDHWGVAYMTGVLAKQVDMTLDYAYCEQELPDRDIYLLPSVRTECMYKSNYDKLKQKVREGATLYISLDNGFFTEFEALTGVRVELSCKSGKVGSFCLDEGVCLPYKKTHTYRLKETRATVLSRDESGDPIFTVASYGKGKVYLLNLPLEAMLLDQQAAFSNNYRRVYQTIFAEQTKSKLVISGDKFVTVTEHCDSERTIICILNYSNEDRDMHLHMKDEWGIKKTWYGKESQIKACDAVIMELECKNS